jgi:calcineurin-like phosphoesterase family protein
MEILKRKPTFFTSDWHIGHENVIKFDNRPFNDIHQMHRALIKNYNNDVPKNGVCYFLGDIGLNNQEMMYSVISKLNGIKVCILGNHDSASTSMYNAGFDVVINSATIYIHNQKVTMSHCPLPGILREDTTGMKGVNEPLNWHGEHKNQRFTVANEGQHHLHGHIHSPNGGRSQKILDRQFDVGVTANKYRVVQYSAVESWIMKNIQEGK